MSDLTIGEAAELSHVEVGQQRIRRMVAEMIQGESKIVSGPVEDVPIYIKNVWLVGVGSIGFFYLVGSLAEEKPDPTKVRQDLAKRIGQLPTSEVDIDKVSGQLLGHRIVGEEVCGGIWVGERKSDKVEITVVCFSPAFTQEEMNFLLKETVKISVRKHGN